MSETAKLQIGNKEYILNIIKDTAGSELLDISPISRDGIFTFDPGLKGTGSCYSEICYINGAAGHLSYRGYAIEDLAANYDYPNVAFLLYHGEFPTPSELDEFNHDIQKNSSLTPGELNIIKNLDDNMHPMGMLLTTVSSLTALESSPHSAEKVDEAMAVLLGKMPSYCAAIIRRSNGKSALQADQNLSYAARFLQQISGNDTNLHLDEDFVRAFDIILTLHAEHEQNASTSSVRVTASTGTNTYAAICAGVASLWGPSHGGANEACIRMLESIASVDHIDDFLAKVKDKSSGVRLMGFGHRVYKNYDPRAKIIQDLCHKILAKNPENDPLFELAVKLEEIARSDDYFVKRNLYPNVDFYSGIILRAMGIPAQCFTLIFALARTSGWISHIKELVDKHPHAITRPRQCFIGSLPS